MLIVTTVSLFVGYNCWVIRSWESSEEKRTHLQIELADGEGEDGGSQADVTEGDASDEVEALGGNGSLTDAQDDAGEEEEVQTHRHQSHEPK